jgi:uncharacterized membrane protein
MAEGAAEGLTENVAGLLCYALLWISGLIFYLVDKRPFVRFHAAQSMVIFGGFNLLYFVIVRLFFRASVVGGYGFFSFGGLFGLVLQLAQLAAFVLWIVLMVKAYQGVRYKVPVAGDIAENIAGR